MSQKDPYFDVRAEVESSLLSAKALHSSYNRILLTLPIESHSTSDELITTKSELESTLSVLLSDISDLDDVVQILEQDVSSSSGPCLKSKFGLSLNEVKKRRAWVTNVQKQLNEMKKSTEAPGPSKSSSSYHPLLPSSPTSPSNRNYNQSASSDNQTHKINSTNSRTNHHRPRFQDDFSQRDLEKQTEEYFHEQESVLLKRQDETLGTISNVVGVLREQATVMGQEVSEQNILLNELDQQIDQTDSKLTKANRRLNRFIEENKNSKSSWTILILIVILTCLLFAIIIV